MLAAPPGAAQRVLDTAQAVSRHRPISKLTPELKVEYQMDGAEQTDKKERLKQWMLWRESRHNVCKDVGCC